MFRRMTDAREWLRSKLQDVIDGGDVTNEELFGAIANPRELQGADRKAWHGLSYWADDEDIRLKDPAYAPMRREGLRKLLEDLNAPQPRS
jgi:hypothetical protein